LITPFPTLIDNNDLYCFFIFLKTFENLTDILCETTDYIIGVPLEKLTFPYFLMNSVALVRKRTIPTERPPLVGEVSANFLWVEGIAWSAQRIPTTVNLGFLDRTYFLIAIGLFIASV
jgi:hypothetical protein